MSLLARLAGLNRTAVFLTTLAVVLLALFLPRTLGGLLLLLLAAALAALLTKTWALTPSTPRALRIVTLVLLIAVGASKLAA